MAVPVVVLILLSLLFNPQLTTFGLLSFVYAANSVIGGFSHGVYGRALSFWGIEDLLSVLSQHGWSLLVAYLLWVSQISLLTLLLDRQTILDRVIFGDFSFWVTLILLWSGAYFIFKYNLLNQIEKEKSLRSEALAHEAQLLMLR